MYQYVDNRNFNLSNDMKINLLFDEMISSKLGICVLNKEYDFTSQMSPGEFMVRSAIGLSIFVNDPIFVDMIDFFNKHTDVGISGLGSSINAIVYRLSRDTIQNKEVIKFTPCCKSTVQHNEVVQVFTYVYNLMINGEIDIKWIKRNRCRRLLPFYREHTQEIRELN